MAAKAWSRRPERRVGRNAWNWQNTRRVGFAAWRWKKKSGVVVPLLVRASAVLKSQGPENWSRGGDPVSFGRVKTRALSGTHRAGKSGGEKNAGGVASCVMWRRRSGVLVVFFSFVNGGRDLSQHIKKAFRSGKSVHVREVSPVPGRLLCDASAGRQSAIRWVGRFVFSVLIRSSWRRCRPRFSRREPSA